MGSYVKEFSNSVQPFSQVNTYNWCLSRIVGMSSRYNRYHSLRLPTVSYSRFCTLDGRKIGIGTCFGTIMQCCEWVCTQLLHGAIYPRKLFAVNGHHTEGPWLKRALLPPWHLCAPHTPRSPGAQPASGSGSEQTPCLLPEVDA